MNEEVANEIPVLQVQMQKRLKVGLNKNDPRNQNFPKNIFLQMWAKLHA